MAKLSNADQMTPNFDKRRFMYFKFRTVVNVTVPAFSSVIPIAKRLNACCFFSPAQSNHWRIETNCHQTPTNFSQSNFNAFQMKHNRELLQSFPSAWKNKPYAIGFLILAQTKVNHCRLEKNLPQTPTSIRIRSFNVWLSTINSLH